MPMSPLRATLGVSQGGSGPLYIAHLHEVLGHLSNDRLARMLSLAGGNNKELLEGARNLRCQVCCMVRPPDNKPQVSYRKPWNFNQRISADCFHVWDIKGAPCST